MAHVGQSANSDPTIRPSRHSARPSIDTNASGLAESTISFSQFPPPPIEIPTTPIRGHFSTSSPIRSALTPVHPLVPRKGPLSARTLETMHEMPPPAPAGRSREGSVTSQATTRPTTHAQISPHDWHDGSSSIDNIDTTEFRMLPTSFITSLLQENKEVRRANRDSFASDAFSGISGLSEMTYPPPGPVRGEASRRPLHMRGGAVRQNARAPPSAFNPARQPPNRMSSDSDTLHSTQGYPPLPRTATTAAPVIVGVASATLQSIPPRPQSALTFPISVDEKTVAYGFSSQDMDDDSILRFKAHNESQPPPNPAPPPNAAHRRPNFNPTATPQVRQSAYSTKSTTSFMSRISVPASFRRMFNWQKKPLPPVPRIPDISLLQEQQSRTQEAAAPLPDLVNRADALHTLLEHGHYPHHSMSSSYQGLPANDHDPVQESYYEQYNTGSTANSRQPLRPQYYSDFAEQISHKPSLAFSNGKQETQVPPKRASCLPVLSRRTKIGLIILVTAIIAGIIAAVVVVVKRKQSSLPDCASGLAGATCSLNSTCVCTSSESRCSPLAQNLIDLIPSVNGIFSSNVTQTDVYNSLWYVQGTMSRDDCSPQSLLVDEGKGLDEVAFPNRTRWTQTALLWHVLQSQDIESANAMRDFVHRAPWKTLSVDGPTNLEDGFTATFSGHIFNFAAQTVTLPTASFVSQGQPTRGQIARVGTIAQAALDRIYTSAQASSTQQEVALRNYWTTTLSQKSNDLSNFKSLLRSAPILLPFNASIPSIRGLFSNSSTSLFPPPLSCYPGLSPKHQDGINSLETSVFQLPASTPASTFNTECYSERPIYGTLDILRLRLPFLDARTGLPRQATILGSEAAPRVVLYSGEMLSSTFPNTTAPSFNNIQLNSRRFGTLAFSSHVILQFLTSMPVPTAIALVTFVLDIGTGSHSPIPPDPSSPLFQTLSTIPVLEVAVFGSIGAPDVSGTVSSFTTNSGSMFFGSAAGAAFRSWTISSYGRTVLWAENATAPRILKDASFDDAVFTQTWKATSDSIDQGSPGVLRSLVSSLESTRKFTAS